ncbi:MAG TPA: hypothetical protein VJB66_02905 [Candidatus Nanoarchaeia archaeon]|nr:hypothetical protein [Candidatus Nanoarchaeia archaeon]
MPGQYIPSDDLLNEIHKLNPEIEPKDVAETYQRKISERLLPVEQCGKRRISDSGEIILEALAHEATVKHYRHNQ